MDEIYNNGNSDEFVGEFNLDDILNEFSDSHVSVEDIIEEKSDIEKEPYEVSTPAEPSIENGPAIGVSEEKESKPNNITDIFDKAPQEAFFSKRSSVHDMPVKEDKKSDKPEITFKAKEDISDYDIVHSYRPVDTSDLDELLKDVDMELKPRSFDPAPEEKPIQSENTHEEKAPVSEIRNSEEEYEELETPVREKPSVFRNIGNAIMAKAAVIAMKRKEQKMNLKSAPPEEAEDLGPEMSADKASRYYGSNVKDLKHRARIASVICLVLIWIGIGLPVGGSLKNNLIASMVSMILLMSVMIVCLDVFTKGLMDIYRKKMGIYSLISISCLISILDAIVIYATKNTEVGLPFCAVSAVAITAALWSSLYMCRGNRITLRTLAISKKPMAVTAEVSNEGKDVTLIKTKTDTESFVRRTEEMTPEEDIYKIVAPWLCIVAVVLAIIAAIIGHNFKNIIHILAAVFMPVVPFTALLCYPLPYARTARRLFNSGTAIAGWSGLVDVGLSNQLIITDSDIFPKETISIENIRVLEGVLPQKIISYAGSIIIASGSCLAPCFKELMERNSCAKEQVEQFCCHEGGGLTAMINGEEVLCGNNGFMKLMGIRLPQKLASKNSVFVSVNGMLSAIFIINYTPLVRVQQALVTLLRTRRNPIFAIRDFNVTPEMIRHKFKIPTDGFDFPSFAKRYELSAMKRGEATKIAAVVSKKGLLPMVEISDRGHRLYETVRLSVLLTILCSVIGIILMFFLSTTGAFDSVSVSNMLLYLFVWLLPELALVYVINT